MTDYIDEAPRRRLRYDPSRRGGEAAYRAAQRHSRIVRALKYILPALAILGGVIFWASARFIPSDLSDLVDQAGIDMQSNSVTMDKPHISGFEGTRRAYEVKADSAVQSLDDPKVLTFSKIDAHIGLEDAGVATVGAATGVYNGNDNTLHLKDGIAIDTDTGYSARTEAALVDFGAGSLVSDTPVQMQGKEGSIRADSVEVTDRGKHIIFRGGVSVTFNPPGDLVASPVPEAQ
jgi:lipopolysaccharide export system protein LptC